MAAAYSTAPRSIAIVGAGVAGLQTLRALQQLPGTEKIVLFERAEEVGGVWRQNYCGFGAQVKRDVYCFAELGPEGLDLYPSGRQLQASCRRYAERFGLLPCLRTGAEVAGLERREDGGWRVTYRRRGLVRRCLGYLALPLQTLPLRLEHPRAARSKAQVSAFMSRLHFCLPWAMWPAYSLRWQLWHGRSAGLADLVGHSVSICNASALKEAFRRPNVRCLRGQISSFTASGAVVEDFYSKRSEELPAQVVIFATGYQECWSHLFDPDLVAALAPHGDGPDLYKQILPTEEVPGLAFIGRILSTCDIVVSHVQAQWLARLLGGSFAAPGLPSRRVAARRYRAWRNQFLPSTGAASRRSVPRVFSYLEELMDDWQEGRRAGCLDFFRPLRAVNLAVASQHTIPARKLVALHSEFSRGSSP
ncbi:unnamed protein product [Effrenium voratum]|nr:unnamed protein product [Effrenium voratum]